MPERNEGIGEVESSAQLRATVENRTRKPAGLLPKNTQQLVILGVAVVMVFIMWITSSAKRTTSIAPAASAAAAIEPPDPATVGDFKEMIQRDQAATRERVSPAGLARLQSMGPTADQTPDGTPRSSGGSVAQPVAVAGTAAGHEAPSPDPMDPIKEDIKKREYLSLFAANVAFTYRRGQEAEKLGEGPTAPAARNDGQTPPRPSSNLATQIIEDQSQMPVTNRATEHAAEKVEPSSTATLREQRQESSGTAPVNPDGPSPGAFNSSTGRKYVVFEGTVLETLLVNRLDGSFSGPVTCLVTSNIYSHDGQHVLIPAGTRALGEVKKVAAFGQQRLALFFHRLIMPDGFSVFLDQFKGLSQIGETALRDKVNNHYLQIFGASLAVGLLGGIAEAGTGNVLTNSPLDRARAGFGSNVASSSMQVLDRFLNVLPTVTIREGNRVKVYLSGDLLLPDYNQHTVQPDL
jgi:type IV secretory pathway VirB10-like protein